MINHSFVISLRTTQGTWGASSHLELEGGGLDPLPFPSSVSPRRGGIFWSSCLTSVELVCPSRGTPPCSALVCVCVWVLWWCPLELLKVSAPVSLRVLWTQIHTIHSHIHTHPHTHTSTHTHTHTIHSHICTHTQPHIYHTLSHTHPPTHTHTHTHTYHTLSYIHPHTPTHIPYTLSHTHTHTHSHTHTHTHTHFPSHEITVGIYIIRETHKYRQSITYGQRCAALYSHRLHQEGTLGTRGPAHKSLQIRANPRKDISFVDSEEAQKSTWIYQRHSFHDN